GRRLDLLELRPGEADQLGHHADHVSGGVSGSPASARARGHHRAGDRADCARSVGPRSSDPPGDPGPVRHDRRDPAIRLPRGLVYPSAMVGDDAGPTVSWGGEALPRSSAVALAAVEAQLTHAYVIGRSTDEEKLVALK